MDQVKVAVCSADSFIVLGVEQLLRADSRYATIPADRMREARIALVVANEVDDETLELLSRVSRSSSAALVLIVDRLEEDDLTKIVKCRVVSVLSRSGVTTDSLRATLDQALAAAPQPELVAQLMSQLERVSTGVLAPKATDESPLSPRERNLIRLLAEGHDTAEIADRLAYSERTVKNIVHGLLSRLELRNRAHAVAYAMRIGAL
jgi:DNA-binding NarL/FixJ family response regulator